MLYKKCFIFLLIFLGQISTTIHGYELKHCYIKDREKHQSNQQLLKTIIEKEIASDVSNKTPIDQANYLSGRITQIANALLKNGFSTDAYAVPQFDQNSFLSFKCFTLWEGDTNPARIPLTFFVYVWPSKELALKYNSSDSRNVYYASNIHSHPISCSFTVLQGSLVQNNYKLIPSFSSKSVRFIDEEIFRKGEGEVDDLKKQFIHQMYNKGDCSEVCISLHAYGLASKKKVMECFNETCFKHSYECQKPNIAICDQ